MAYLSGSIPRSSMFQADLEAKQRLLSRVAVASSLILAAFVVIIFALLPGIKPGKVIAILATLGLAAIGWTSLQPRLYKPSAIATVVILMLAGFAGSLTNGGLEGYVAPILLTSPIAAALFLGTRATIISAGTVVVLYTLLLLIEPYGIVQPEPYPADLTAVAALVLLATATALCTAGIGYFAYDSQDKIRSLTDIQGKLVEAADKLQHAAHHDVLTGIANRQKLQEYLETLVTNDANADAQICLIHVDLDKFKEVNDTHGHPVGDGVLREAAQRMTQICRDADLVSRVGGDEFVIVTTKSRLAPAEMIQDLSERIINQINRPIFVNGVECHVDASIGYIISDIACSSVESLIANADIALYESKRSGRGVARQFTGAMREGIELQRSKLSDLKRAFTEDRITCALQPQICFQSGALQSVEALGRIRNQSGSILVPADFLDTLQDVGLIDAFDERVMCKALDALIELRGQGFQLPSISVNASAKSLRSSDYIEKIQRQLSVRNLSHEDIVVEVLESTLIEDRDDMAAKTIGELCDTGIKTVMDDFGSGHASMGALLDLKLDGIKIDRSLITDIDCERSRTVVEAVLKLSQGLNLTTVVEGVETARQFHVLQSMGCDAAQGFGICKPLELTDLAEWLERFGRSEVAYLQGFVRRSAIA